MHCCLYFLSDSFSKQTGLQMCLVQSPQAEAIDSTLRRADLWYGGGVALGDAEFYLVRFCRWHDWDHAYE